MDPKIQEKCNDYKDLANWRVKNDNTIEYSYKGFPLPLVCSYKPNYFSGWSFYEKLRESCDKDSNNCIKDDNFCSLDQDNKCSFDENRIPDKNNKENIYNSDIVNPTRNEMKGITINDNHRNLVNHLDSKNVLSGRGENHTISIVEADCNKYTGGDKNASNIEYYTCEPGIIRYPEVNFAKYNKDYNDPNLHFVKIVKEEDDDKIPEGLEDIQGLQWQPEMYKSLLTELQTNIKFRECIDDKLGIKKLKGYEEFINDVESENFKIEKYIDFIKSACDEFISLPPDKIKECIDKLNYSEVLKNNICEGDITLTMIDSYNLVLEFIGIHIDFKELKQETIIKLTPLIKEVLYKVITTSQYYEQTLCKGKTSNVTKNLKTMYNTLFDTHKSIEYPFKNLNITSNFFNEFTKNIYVKIILLVFVAFIFAKIVDLFSNKNYYQVPVNTK